MRFSRCTFAGLLCIAFLAPSWLSLHAGEKSVEVKNGVVVSVSAHGSDAGLSIFAGLLRYEEVQAGVVRHAVRFTLNTINSTYHLWPARFHPAYANTPSASLPPMGARFRLKASFNVSSYSRDAQVILTALKHYGMFLADIGDDWTIGGTSDPRWSSSLGSELQSVPSSAFEVGALTLGSWELEVGS